MIELIKRKMDWVGVIVKSTKPLKNGWASLPAGKVFTVKNWSKGLSMDSDPCDCCGISLSISRVQPHDVEVLDIEYNREIIEWNSKRKRVKGMYGTHTQEPSEPKPVYKP